MGIRIVGDDEASVAHRAALDRQIAESYEPVADAWDALWNVAREFHEWRGGTYDDRLYDVLFQWCTGLALLVHGQTETQRQEVEEGEPLSEERERWIKEVCEGAPALFTAGLFRLVVAYRTALVETVADKDPVERLRDLMVGSLQTAMDELRAMDIQAIRVAQEQEERCEE